MTSEAHGREATRPLESRPLDNRPPETDSLTLAFDDNRHRAVHYSAKLPPLP